MRFKYRADGLKSQKNGLDFYLKVRQNGGTRLSTPLQNQVNQGNIILQDFFGNPLP